jgi:hypothetical protein
MAWNNEMASAAHSLTFLYWYITWPWGSIQRFGNGTDPIEYSYPSTSFGVPLWDFYAVPPQTGGRFIGGLPIDFWNGYDPVAGAAYIFIFTPVFAYSIGVAQLDPKKWDTSSPWQPKLRRPPPTAHDLP